MSLIKQKQTNGKSGKYMIARALDLNASNRD